VSLTTYRDKRRFERTPEPKGKPARTRGPLRFVVQKHQASRLHYDFRLELDGVLKSWAIPKGPSLNPEDKRLAMMVEDHPLEYRTFEGIIPAGNYGAGTVMVWDQGTYCSRQTPDRKESDRLLREGLAKGHLTFVLNGEKLKGEFALLRLKRGEENAWILVKKRDQFASSAAVIEQDRSVVSGRTLEEIARKSRRVWHSHRPSKIRSSADGKKANPDLDDAPRAQMPHRIKPMLASPVTKAFDKPGWLFEVKWDGYRAIAEVDGDKVALYSRNFQPYEERFRPVVAALRGLGRQTILDGELVVVDDRGRSQFQLLQGYLKKGQGRPIYYVFDLLYLDGHDLQRLPLTRRKELLQEVVRGVPGILVSEHVEEQGVAFFEAALAQNLEGIVAKNGTSVYREGARSHEWLKVKIHHRQEAVIGGFTEPRGGRQKLGALVLGVYDKGDLVYIGHTGSGMDARGLEDLYARLLPLVQSKCPFRVRPATNAKVHWVKPELVCEVKFREWTEDGVLRFPIFLGLGEDKPAREVRREGAGAAPSPDETQKPLSGGRQPPERATGQGAHAPRSETPAPPSLKLTNLNKVYWPDDGITKGDLIAYYREIAPVILPYLRDRPESLNRHPNGITAANFFQKDMRKQPPPDWIQTATLPSDSDKKAITYLLCQDEPTLLYMANLGCIEINPWNSRYQTPENPDYLIIDLDPEAVSFDRVIETAVATRKLLDGIGARSCCKTSGKRGLHIMVPLAAQYDYDQVRQFAEILANFVHEQLPDSTSVVRSPAQRQGCVYLDYLQNRRGQTIAAPYSVRPHPGGTVSTPLRWQEVKRGLDSGKFTIRTMPRRLERVGDLWKPILGPGIDLAACLEKLTKLKKR
jgi:bifunctional non-homologous end joining protein LigD